ncbi:MBL fold metallo-hydrolase [Candidatus Solirubrobacter pratensis]|uniref:hypothetical protein n=1 Tax=Candidatus Solirubrobacter pratensis TaxID=1298857 RepID=UPI0004288416|nr:hypothetical protein [Candidatus Solirubrobacter pratensis]
MTPPSDPRASDGLEDLGGGIWRWALPHPEWRPRSEVVACYAVRAGADTVLIDPLLGDGIAEQLDAIVSGSVTVAVTIPYHVRSAAEASERWNARIVGHPDLARRLPGLTVHERAPGVELFAIPSHKERPVEVGDALAFGDRFVGVGGGLRIWAQRPFTPRHYERLRRYLAPLFDHPFERVLVGHGAPVLHDGKAALAEALESEPWTGGD